MFKYFLSFVVFLFALSSMNAEIKLIQLKVLDDVDPESNYSNSALRGAFPMNDQTSYMLPVSRKKVQGMNMPFIKGYGHEVLLVGPFLDMCGDIQILDQSNRVKGTIRTNAFINKGKNWFWFPNERRVKNEGYVHFRISKSIMESINTQNFKIKVGNVEDLDVIDCLVADRFHIDAVLFTGNVVPQRELDNFTKINAGTVNNIRTIKNTFNPQATYNVKIKINGGVIPRYSFQLIHDNLFYHLGQQTIYNKECRGNLKLNGSISKTKLIEDNDAVTMQLSSSVMSEISRRDKEGFLIGLIDGKIGDFSSINIDKNAAAVASGDVLTREENPNSWGPYICARFSSDVYKFGQYTDLGKVEIGTCDRRPPSGSIQQKPALINKDPNIRR